MERSCFSVRSCTSFIKTLNGFSLNLVTSNLRNLGQTDFIRLRKDKRTMLNHYAMTHQITGGAASGFEE
jgi:hypothetical protein